jgi:hypothetical protein
VFCRTGRIVEMPGRMEHLHVEESPTRLTDEW